MLLKRNPQGLWQLWNVAVIVVVLAAPFVASAVAGPGAATAVVAAVVAYLVVGHRRRQGAFDRAVAGARPDPDGATLLAAMVRRLEDDPQSVRHRAVYPLSTSGVPTVAERGVALVRIRQAVAAFLAAGGDPTTVVGHLPKYEFEHGDKGLVVSSSQPVAIDAHRAGEADAWEIEYVDVSVKRRRSCASDDNAEAVFARLAVAAAEQGIAERLTTS